jgi:hypothetical protein
VLTYRPVLQRGTHAYTVGGAQVEVVEVDHCPHRGTRYLVRQVGGYVVHRAGQWVDRAPLCWVEAYEVSEHEQDLPPLAWYGGRTQR